MDPISALISGGSSLLGGAMSNLWGGANTQAANQQNLGNAYLQAQWNLASQQQNQQWMTQMANTAYQRGTADMKAAGLNPALMYGSGGPASTPSSSPAQMSIPAQIVKPSGDIISPAVASALQAATVIKNLQKTDAEIQTETARAADTWSHVDVNKVAPGVARAQIENLSNSAFNLKKQGENIALKNENLSKFGVSELHPQTPIGKAAFDAAHAAQAAASYVSPIWHQFASDSPTAKSLSQDRKPELRNNRIGRPPQSGDLSWAQ